MIGRRPLFVWELNERLRRLDCAFLGFLTPSHSKDWTSRVSFFGRSLSSSAVEVNSVCLCQLYIRRQSLEDLVTTNNN